MPKMQYTEKFMRFWQIYPADLSHSKKGSKFNALKAFLKYSDEEQDRIIFDTEALIRFDRQDSKPDRWPHASTYLNQRYFEREAGSIADQKEKVELSQCCIESCNNEVHGPKYDKCSEHVLAEDDKWKDTRKTVFMETGLRKLKDESMSEFANRCRQYLLKSGEYGKALDKRPDYLSENGQKSPQSNQSLTSKSESTGSETFDRDYFKKQGWKVLDY